jgi:hypothetical protein
MNAIKANSWFFTQVVTISSDRALRLDTIFEGEDEDDEGQENGGSGSEPCPPDVVYSFYTDSIHCGTVADHSNSLRHRLSPRSLSVNMESAMPSQQAPRSSPLARRRGMNQSREKGALRNEELGVSSIAL